VGAFREDGAAAKTRPILWNRADSREVLHMKRFIAVLLSAAAAIGGCAEPAGVRAGASRGAAEPLRIVCFGDSITGYHPRTPYLHAFIKFSDLLQLMLEARMGAERAVVLNRGWASDTSADALRRLQGDVLGEKPRIAIVLIGGNDEKDDPQDRDATRANLSAIASRIQAAGIRCLLLQYHVLPNPQAPHLAWEALAGNNDTIAAVAREHRTALLDMKAAMEKAAKRHRRAELVDEIDGVHLRPRGEMVYARSIFRKLEQLGWITAGRD
jgi:lysophospholipase L1-like esterase